MASMSLSPNERNAVGECRSRVRRLSAFFAANAPPESDEPQDWLAYLARFKDELGNVNNDLGLFATLVAEDYLVRVMDVRPFDAAAKPQGAPGLDIDERTKSGDRVIAEIKTTHPYTQGDLGAQQASTFEKDPKKLAREAAPHKFFFLTDAATFAVMRKPKYRNMFKGVRIVLLPSGEEIAA